MKPKEKALEIINNMYDCIQIPDPDRSDSKSCAIVCVKYIIADIKVRPIEDVSEALVYWNEVLDELNKL